MYINFEHHFLLNFVCALQAETTISRATRRRVGVVFVPPYLWFSCADGINCAARIRLSRTTKRRAAVTAQLLLGTVCSMKIHEHVYVYYTAEVTSPNCDGTIRSKKKHVQHRRFNTSAQRCGEHNDADGFVIMLTPADANRHGGPTIGKKIFCDVCAHLRYPGGCTRHFFLRSHVFARKRTSHGITYERVACRAMYMLYSYVEYE